MTASPNSLNGSQRQRLLITCKHIDHLLSDIEQTLNASMSKGVFPNYVNDISQEERKTIEEYVASLRREIVRVLASQSLTIGDPHISATHSIEVGLTFVEVAIDELAPRYMRGYGPVSEQGAIDLQSIMTSLHAVSKEMHHYVQHLSQVAQQNQAG